MAGRYIALLGLAALVGCGSEPVPDAHTGGSPEGAVRLAGAADAGAAIAGRIEALGLDAQTDLQGPEEGLWRFCAGGADVLVLAQVPKVDDMAACRARRIGYTSKARPEGAVVISAAALAAFPALAGL